MLTETTPPKVDTLHTQPRLAIIAGSAFAVLQGVDGVTLKHAIDSPAGDPAGIALRGVP